VYWGDEEVCEVKKIDAGKGVVEIKKVKKMEEAHPARCTCGFAVEHRIASGSVVAGLGSGGENGVGRRQKISCRTDLLLRKPPRLANGETLKQRASEKAVTTAKRIELLWRFGDCDSGTAGFGENLCGRGMICELVSVERKWELRR